MAGPQHELEIRENRAGDVAGQHSESGDSLGDKLLREVEMVGYGLVKGVGDELGKAAADPLSAGAKLAAGAVIGGAMAYFGRGAGLGSLMTRGAGAAMGLAFAADLADPTRLAAIGEAGRLAWSSRANMDRSIDLIGLSVGSLAVDTALMGAGGALGGYALGGGRAARLDAALGRLKTSVLESMESLAMAQPGGLRPAFALGYEGAGVSGRPLAAAMERPSVARPTILEARSLKDGGGSPVELPRVTAQELETRFGKMAEAPTIEALSHQLSLGEFRTQLEMIAKSGLVKPEVRQAILGARDIRVVPPFSAQQDMRGVDAWLAFLNERGLVSAHGPLDFSFLPKETPWLLRLNNDWYRMNGERIGFASTSERAVGQLRKSLAEALMRRDYPIELNRHPFALEGLKDVPTPIDIDSKLADKLLRRVS